jgi:N-acyl-phosphatidylethanolamine-hydrolysing phospholipase D
MDSFCFQISKLFVVSIVLLFSLTCAAQTRPPDKKHYTGDGFRNIYIENKSRFFDFLKWRWNRLWKNTQRPEKYHFPLARNDPAFLKTNHEKITLTWIGHATVLLQLAGRNILTDPHFSKRASPVQWAGPQRVVPPGISLEDLPPIHIVVISHDHYDSLDKQTIIRLRKRKGGEQTLFLVPLGLRGWFNRLGISRVIELDWWDQHEQGPLRIVAVPVQHWSKRGLFTRNKTLWAGWVILTDNFRFFFVGDTGYSPLFREIGRKLGPFDLTAIPIGAYEPRWFMADHHITPEESLQIHQDVGSEKSVAIHWGTFILTDEPLDEPPKRLHRARREKRFLEEDFLILKHGETILLN